MPSLVTLRVVCCGDRAWRVAFLLDRNQARAGDCPQLTAVALPDLLPRRKLCCQMNAPAIFISRLSGRLRGGALLANFVLAFVWVAMLLMVGGCCCEGFQIMVVSSRPSYPFRLGGGTLAIAYDAWR